MKKVIVFFSIVIFFFSGIANVALPTFKWLTEPC